MIETDINQDKIEMLFSFIISQNNNIKRIKGIIERLCENFGEDKNGYYTFPTAEKMATLTLDDLAPLRSGFRAKYIIDAANKVTSGETNLEKILENSPSNAILSVSEMNGEVSVINENGEKIAGI